MSNDDKGRLERIAKTVEVLASEVRTAERLNLKFSITGFAAWIVMMFTLSPEVSFLAFIAAICFFGMNALLRVIRIRLLSILNDLNRLS